MGLLATVRLARWRLWRLRGRPDLLCVAAAYGEEWLIAAAGGWSAAFVLLLALFVSSSGAAARP